MAVMANVSRPLLALLVGTVAFFLLWIVALKPGSSSSGSSSGGVGRYQPAIDQAKKAVGTANAASAAHGGTVPGTLSPPGTLPSHAAATSPHTMSGAASAAATPSRTGTDVAGSSASKRRLNVVERALAAHKVIAMLFYNPAGADDRAVASELATIPASKERVVKLAVPLSELARYSVVTTQVPVDVSPTLVLIDSRRHASTLVGYADRFEIAQRVTDALSGR
jgi:hypothetical protein